LSPESRGLPMAPHQEVRHALGIQIIIRTEGVDPKSVVGGFDRGSGSHGEGGRISVLAEPLYFQRGEAL